MEQGYDSKTTYNTQNKLNVYYFTQKVAVLDIQDNLEEIVSMRLGFPSQSIIVIKMDVANQKGMEATYEEIAKTFGHLDIVVNVAGLFNDQDVQRTILVNLGGMINSTLNALKIMSKDQGGKGGIICNMSSVVGLDPMFLVPVYAATKAGIINFTRCLGVRIHQISTNIFIIILIFPSTERHIFSTNRGQDDNCLPGRHNHRYVYQLY